MNVSEELARLAQLRDDGVLTEDEFQSQKAAVLAGGRAPASAPVAKPKSKLVGCLVVAAVIVVVLLIIGALAGPASKQGNVQAPTVGTADEKASAEPTATADTSKPALTMDGYNRIRNGMTFAQVTAIVGEPSQEMARNEIAGTETVMYMWQGSFGANMNAMFQNGKLMQKAQIGLR